MISNLPPPFATVEYDPKQRLTYVYVFPDEYDAFVNSYCDSFQLNPNLRPILLKDGTMRIRLIASNQPYFDHYGVNDNEMIIKRVEEENG